MKLSRYVRITILLVVIFGASILVAAYSYYFVPQTSQLRILYTHSPKMVEEVVVSFKAWFQEKYGQQIEITTTKTSSQEAYAKAEAWTMDPGADIWWGGPVSFFNTTIADLLQYNSNYKDQINATCRGYSPQMDNRNPPYWYATSHYGLGIMYNQHALDVLNLNLPSSWNDLLEQKYMEKIAMTAPTNSEFTFQLITLILQSKMQTINGTQNWADGWEYLIKLAGSITEYDSNEDDTAFKVSSGYLPLAIVPDFYAFDKMAIPVPDINFKYLDATPLQPDPIAIFKKGKYLNEAKAFVDFVLTQQAQNLIGKHLLPIRSDASTTPPRINPFSLSFPLLTGYNKTFEANMSGIIRDYYSTWITGKQSQVKTMWKGLVEVNERKGNNTQANLYYNLAYGNFTYLERYLNRTYLDKIYNLTNRWTNDVKRQQYITQWTGNCTTRYAYVTQNILLAKDVL